MNFAFILSHKPVSGTICVEVFAKLALKNFAFILSQMTKNWDKNGEKTAKK